MIRFLCPVCSASGSIKAEIVGRKALCPNCRTNLRIVADGVAKDASSAADDPGGEIQPKADEVRASLPEPSASGSRAEQVPAAPEPGSASEAKPAPPPVTTSDSGVSAAPAPASVSEQKRELMGESGALQEQPGNGPSSSEAVAHRDAALRRGAESMSVPREGAREEKECPFCAERIKAKAAKCRFCGGVFSEVRPAGKAPQGGKVEGGADSSSPVHQQGETPPPLPKGWAQRGGEWWYLRGSEKSGPHTLEELDRAAGSGWVDPETPVWKKGTERWMRAKEVAELREGVSPSLPRERKGGSDAGSSRPPGKSVVLAVVLSVLWPGLGEYYVGEQTKGLYRIILSSVPLLFYFSDPIYKLLLPLFEVTSGHLPLYAYCVIWLFGVIASFRAAEKAIQAATGLQKECPECAELVKAAAVKCRYCGSGL